MDHSQNLEAHALRTRPRVRDRVVLWLHRFAERHDWVPAEFGAAEPVDAEDGAALLREWVRQAKLWAGYNPEEMLALKAGAVVLGIALLALIVMVGALG